MDRVFVWSRIDEELAQQVKDLEKRLGLDFEHLLVLLLRSYFEGELQKRAEEEGEEL